jgi:energy coupling factor transporter S component ThiW
MADKNKATGAQRLIFAGLLAAVAIVLSPVVSFPLGFATPFPIQHMVNAIAGVFLGPWYAVLVAVIVALIRNILNTGSIFAFPGGIFGGLVVGVFHRYLIKRDYAALFEPIGTVLIGATVSAYLVGPIAFQVGLISTLGTLYTFVISFSASCISGSVLGFIVIKLMRRIGLAKILETERKVAETKEV